MVVCSCLYPGVPCYLYNTNDGTLYRTDSERPVESFREEQDAQKDIGGGENDIEVRYKSNGGTTQSSFIENPMLTSMGGTENEDVKQIKERNAELEAENNRVHSENLELRFENQTIKAEVQTLQFKNEHLESENNEMRIEYGAQF